MTRSSLPRLILIQILILSSFLPFLAACAPAPASDLENSTDSQGLTPATAPTRPLAPSPTREPAFIPSPTSPTTPLLVLPDKPGAAGGTWTEAEARELTRQAEALWADVHAIAGAHPPADVAQVQPVVTERDGQWLVVGLRLSGQDAAQVYGEGAVLTIGIDPETKEKGMLTLSLDGARLALEKQAGLKEAQMAELGLSGPVFMDGRWLVFDKEGLPRVVVNEKNQWQALTVLETANAPLTYFLSADTLYLWSRDKQQFDTLTFPEEITEVQAKGESLKVTLADGTEKTLTQDKETGGWKEAQVYRAFTELAPTAENMPVIKDAVADALVDGAFLDETEITEKIQAGELKVVRDEKTGAVVVFTGEMLKYMKEQGQSVESSDAAKLFQTLEEQNREVFSKWTEAKYFDYDEYYTKRLDYPEDLQTFAERLAQSGGFLPLPPEWMTFTVRLNQANQPEVIAILPQFLDPWDRSYPAGKRIFGNPISFPDDKRLVLGVKLGLENDGQVKKQFIQAPFITRYRGQQLTLESETNKLVNRDEYQTVTHEWDEAAGQWRELDEYRVYGDPAERMAYVLNYKLNEVRYADTYHENPLGLDPEIVAEAVRLLKEGKPMDEINRGLMELYKKKSIEEINANEAKAAGIYILVDAEGNPAQIAIAGGEYGLSQEHLAALIKAHKAINETDPNEIRDESIKGTKFISMGTSFIVLEKNDIRVSSSDTDVVIGKKSEEPTIRYWIDLLISESREVDGTRRSVEDGRVMVPGDDTVYKNFGHYAMTKALEWFNTHGDELVRRGYITRKDLSEIKGGIEYNLKRYRNAN